MIYWYLLTAVKLLNNPSFVCLRNESPITKCINNQYNK